MGDLLPDFLIIGGQKCGTTTLYFDLLASPQVYFPNDKEPGNLAYSDVLGKAGKSDYAHLYKGARRGQRRGDASTLYTMLENSERAAWHANQILGKEIDVFYVIRDPLDRIRSQYRHYWSTGSEDRPIDIAVLDDPEYVLRSSYAYQLKPWRDLFSDRVHVIQFETLIAQRCETANRIARILGIAPYGENIEREHVYNASEDRQSLGVGWKLFQGSQIYRNVLRPILSPQMRRRVRKRLLPPAPRPPSDELSESTVRELVSRLSKDLTKHSEVLGMAPWTVQSLLDAHLKTVS